MPSPLARFAKACEDRYESLLLLSASQAGGNLQLRADDCLKWADRLYTQQYRMGRLHRLCDSPLDLSVSRLGLCFGSRHLALCYNYFVNKF